MLAALDVVSNLGESMAKPSAILLLQTKAEQAGRLQRGLGGKQHQRARHACDGSVS